MRKVLRTVLAIATCFTLATACDKDDEPVKEPVENPGENQEEPGKNPEEDPGENPENPGEDPGEEPGNEPGEEPGEVSDLEGSHYEYIVKSKRISKSGEFLSGFYYDNFWDDGWTFNYSVSELNSYLQLGNSMNIELFAGAKELFDGKEFDVTATSYPFSFKFQYVDTSIGTTVDVVIDNNNTEGASGTIALKRNARGSYDAVFDLSMNSGDVTVKGYYAEALQPRNTIYSTAKDEGLLATVKAVTLDISGDPCILYISTKDGEAGPNNYDVKGLVAKAEWKFDKFMAFSGQGSSIQWLDGVEYSSATANTTPVFGGNWKVTEPVTVAGGKKVAECSSTLFGNGNRFIYYYGEVKVIE